MSVLHATAEQVLAFRLAAQGLAGPRDRTPTQVAATWALQDSPPGAAALALNARVAQLTPGALDDALAKRELVGEVELVEVSVDGRSPTWLLAEDAPALAAPPPPAPGARLVGVGDPLLQARDRDLLIPDEQARKRLFGALANPGLALVDGRPAALWRPRKQGKRLVVALEPLRELDERTRAAIAREAEGIAALRGAAGARLG